MVRDVDRSITLHCLLEYETVTLCFYEKYNPLPWIMTFTAGQIYGNVQVINPFV